MGDSPGLGPIEFFDPRAFLAEVKDAFADEPVRCTFLARCVADGCQGFGAERCGCGGRSNTRYSSRQCGTLGAAGPPSPRPPFSPLLHMVAGPGCRALNVRVFWRRGEPQGCIEQLGQIFEKRKVGTEIPRCHTEYGRGVVVVVGGGGGGGGGHLLHLLSTSACRT